MDERFVSGPTNQRGRFPYQWLPPKDKESIKNRVKTPISRKKVRIADFTEITERGPIPEFSVIDNTKNREEIPKQAGTKWNPQPCCSNEKKKLPTNHVKSLTDAITYWKQISVISSTPITLALSNVAPTSKPSIGQMRPSTYRRVRNNKNQPTDVNSVESPISQKSVKPENTESRANKNRNYSLPPKKTGKRTKLEKKISVPTIVTHNHKSITLTTPLGRKLIHTFQKRADLINHATVSASRDIHVERPIGAVDQRRSLETKTNIIHNIGNRGGGRERSLKRKVVNNNRGIEKNENRKPEVLLKIKQTLLKQIAKKKNSEEEEKKRDKRKNMAAMRSKKGKEVEKQTERMKLRKTKEVESRLGGEVKNSLAKSVNNQRSNSKKAKRHRRLKNKTSIEAFSMQVAPGSNDPFSRADKKDKVERSRRERKGSQVLINSWPDKDQSPPTRSRMEINCKMCKRCPMRQLISKIDPTVGSDRTTYPVIAFTCCRKAPKPKETSTSTSDLGHLGAIFTQDQKESSTELAFKYAVYKINKDRHLLPNTSLMYDIQYVPRDDSFRTTKKACGQVESGVQGMFGPWEPILGAHVQSLCEALDLPHIEARLDLDPGFRELSINLHPPQNHLNAAVKDLISFLNWTKVAVVYEEDYGLFKMQDLVKGPPGSRTEMYIRQANPGTYRHVLREIRQKDIFKVIVDTNPLHMNHFFKSILQLQMNDYRYHYMFTTFDIETFDLEDFKYNSVNMTAFRLVDVENPKVAETLSQMERFQPVGHAILNRSGLIQAEPALVYDSVHVFATGLASLDASHTLRPANLSCDLEVPWQDGPSLYNYINAVTLHGLTGRIEFTEGRRSNFKMDLLKLKRENLRKVGEWSPGSGLNVTDSTAFYETTTPNITLIVMTREERPYVMVREGNATGNARYEGFCIDLLKWVATEVGFQYAIRLVPDHKYGVYDPETKQWNGIVRELIEKRADLAVASMTINYARESVIDFTKPFMNLGIGILFKVPSSQPARLFSFMNPLAVEIWLYVLAAYLLVSFTLFVMARFSPYEWNNPHPCSPEAHVIENQFSISNSFWFITGTFLRQGSGLNPKATSTRIVGGIWWFFTLIIISSYTANLAAFLTVERMITPIESAADLSEQTDIAYGTLDGGSTMTFFRDSKIGIYQKMWRYMESKKPTVFVPSYEDGIKRVLEGNYAFLMESTMLDYAVQRDCNLTQIGGLLDSKGYGIATPKGSPWRDKISLAILELQEKGNIQILYDKWWKNTGDVCNREEKNKESKANALGVENIGGVFVVLLCGLSLAILVAILEFCWNSKKNAQTDRQSLCSEMAEELRFAVRCHGSRQRPALKRSCTRCSPGTTYVPSALEIQHINGETSLLPMMELKKSSLSYETDT